MRNLPPPPNGSPLTSLTERREYLSNPTVAYRLPREGVVMLGDGWITEIRATEFSVWTGDESRETELSASQTQELVGIWTALWTATLPERSTTVLLHYRGAFRTASAPADAPLQAWLTKALAEG